MDQEEDEEEEELDKKDQRSELDDKKNSSRPDEILNEEKKTPSNQNARFNDTEQNDEPTKLPLPVSSKTETQVSSMADAIRLRQQRQQTISKKD